LTLRFNRIVSLGISFLILLLITNCNQNAPRNNIFDPESELYGQTGKLTGTVSSIYLPYSPIPGVKIEIANENRYSETDINGQFSFPNLRPGESIVVFSAEGFYQVIDTLDIQAAETLDHQIFMNGIPSIQSVNLKTRHIAHWQPTEDEFMLDVEVGVYDHDGNLDIDSVVFRIPNWNFQRGLVVGLSSSSYVGAYFNDEFNPFAFPEIQGELMQFECRDKSGLWGPIYQTQVSRLIVSTPLTLSPAGLNTVDSLPVFRWSQFDAGFEVQYEVDIFRLDESAIPVHILSSPLLTDTTLQWQIESALAETRYYWTLTVYDRYNNLSVSREASFVVVSS